MSINWQLNHIFIFPSMCLNSVHHSFFQTFYDMLFEFDNVEFFTEDWLMDQWMCNFVASDSSKFHLDWMRTGVFFMEMYGVILWHWTEIPFQLSCILKFIALLESQNLVQITYNIYLNPTSTSKSILSIECHKIKSFRN